MFKRLAVFAVGALVAASFGVPTAAAQEPPDYGSFTLTVDKTAYTDLFPTAITLTGTYTCSANFIVDPAFSGIGVNVQQTQHGIQRGVIFVTGGSFYGPLNCNGETQDWTADVWANYQGGQATWKNGRAAVTVNGNASAGQCQLDTQCQGIGTEVDTFIHIH
jgi:hypothetical protein